VIDPAEIAAEALAALDDARQIVPFSERQPPLDPQEAYAIAAAFRQLRMARRETPIGRKVGFTNRGIWDEYGVRAPIWGHVYDTTLVPLAGHGTVSVSHLPEPRIEPEIVLGLERDLAPGMSASQIADAIGWVAHGFEIVQSIFPGWRFALADCVADGALHGLLLMGPRRPVFRGDRAGLAASLAGLRVTLSRDGAVMDTGAGSNVLDGPVDALAHLVAVLAADPLNPPLKAGEMISTGTMTRAFPVAPGETWTTAIDGFPLNGLSVTFD
jgi:2-oxo-3-hexenedioate decarboxylase